MADEIVFYTNPASRGRIARWMLEEIGAPYRTVYLDFGAAMKSPDYLSVNPMGKVPAIVHGTRTVTECAAICAYLADAFPEKDLAPAPAERADYYRWPFFCAGPLEAASINRSLGFDVPKERERAVGYGNFEAVMDTLEHAVSQGPYVAGDSFSAADVYVGSHIGWGPFCRHDGETPGLHGLSRPGDGKAGLPAGFPDRRGRGQADGHGFRVT